MAKIAVCPCAAAVAATATTRSLRPRRDDRRQQRLCSHRRSHRLAVLAAATMPTANDASKETEQAIEVLYKACETRTVPSKSVGDAIKLLEKKKLLNNEQDWPQTLGGGEGGRRWTLVFTTLEKKRSSIAPEGLYFPVNAVQKFDSGENRISNGIFFGHLAALWFSGPMKTQGKQLIFDFTSINFRLLGLRLTRSLKDDYSFEEKASSTGKPPKPGDYPFFSWIYVDDSIAVARGGGGGLAIWARTNPSWELERGVDF